MANTDKIINLERLTEYDGLIKSYIDSKVSGGSGVGQKGSEWNAEIFNSYTTNHATGDHSHAEGYETTAMGSKAHAEGGGTLAQGTSSHSEGGWTKAIGDLSHTEGYKTIAQGENSHAEGADSVTGGTTGTNQYDFDYDNNATQLFGKAAHAEGVATWAKGPASHSEGISTIAKGKAAHAGGHFTEANGWYSYAGGGDTIADGDYSFAHGIRAKATAKNAYALGADVYASGIHSFATGNETRAEANESVAMGYGSITEGVHSLSGGTRAVAYGENAFAFGSGNEGVTYSVFGNDSNSFGVSSATDFEVGDYVLFSHAYQNYSFIGRIAAKYDSQSFQLASNFPEIDGSNTYATVCKYYPTLAKGKSSFATGIGVKATADAQAVVGKHNAIVNNALFIVGNGTAGAPNNAFYVTTDNKAYVNGSQVLTVANINSLLPAAETEGF